MGFKHLCTVLGNQLGERTRLTLAFVLVIGGLSILIPGSGRAPAISASSPAPLSTSLPLPAAVSTPEHFPSPTPEPINPVFLPFIALVSTPEIAGTESIHLVTSLVRPRSAFVDYDFLPGSKPLTVRLIPPDHRFNAGLPLEITFIPGERCLFGDRQACIYQFATVENRQIIFASLHSGVGGEGQALRHALEGTGFNRGQYLPHQVAENARALAGARVALLQGKKDRSHFELAAVARIPPEHLQAYFALPVEQTLAFAVSIGALDPRLLEDDVFVIETCGWRLPGEDWVPGVSTTTGSVYLALIRAAP